jgi:outer membrane protein assembly factor BamB
LPVVAAFPASNEGTPLSPAPIETVDALPVFDEQGPRPGRAPPALVAAFPAEGPPPSVAAAPGEVPVVLAALPAEAVDTPGQAAASSRDEAPSQPASPALAAQSRRARRKRPINKLKLAVSLLGVVLAVGFGYWFFGPPPPSKDPDWRWANCKKLYDERKWAAAIREFKRFEPDFPDDPRVAQIPFFLAMCDAGDDVYGDPGNPERGLKTAQDVFRDHRDNSAYQDYCIDLYQALAHLIEARFLKPTDAGVEPEQVTRAEEAFGLLKTVNEAIKEPWVAERTGKLDALIAEGRKGSANLVATRKAKNLIEDLQGRKPGLDPDKVYRDLERLLATHPDLRQGRDLRDRLTEVYKSEPAQVRFEREDPANQPPPERGPADDSGRQGNTLVIAWGKPARGAATVPAGDVVLALARGILYAFDAQGKLCWARRLGVDSTRLPERIAPGRELQAGLVAVDSENNTLLALDPASGEPRWRYRVGSDIVAPLTIVPRQALPNAPKRLFGLLPTAEGEIHVVELVLGKRLGRFAVGQPMTVGGTYDPATELAFFPADAQRIFAIDPAAIDHPGDPKHPGCRFIVFTGHSSGAVRSEPMIVGQYLLVAEATELEHTRLRAFELRGKDFPLPAADPAKNGLFPRPSSADLKQQRLRGWAWFAPHATPDRITLVTDHGDLGVFGLNLDNPDEAIYSIVQVAPDQAAVPMFRREPFRNLVIAAEEHLLWVMADGRLQKLSLDIVHQQVKSLWAKDDPEIGVRGIPIHEAQADRRGEVFYLATMSPSGQVYHLTAVDAETGRRQWQRQLGLNILGDPLVYEDYVVLVDQAGRTLAQQPRPGFVHSRLPRKVLLPGEQGLPPGADDASPMCLGEPPGPVHLAVTLDQGRKVAVRPVRIPFGDDEPWQEVTLHGQLQGRPCVCSGFLVAPCSDGQLYRFPLGPGSVLGRNEVSFTWAEFKTPGADTAQVYSMGPDTVLLVDGARRIRRLQLRTEGDVTEWKEVGTAFYSTSPLTAQPLTLGQDIYVCDSEGTLLRLDATNPVRCLRRWPLGAQVTAGPVLRKDRLLLVLEGRKLMWIDPDAARPCWTSKPLPGRIVGMPSRAGNTLLVADTSRRLTGLSVDSGEKLWSEPLGVRVGPAAAAVPYGAEKVLVPLVDGSVLVLPIAAETGPPSARLANKPGN